MHGPSYKMAKGLGPALVANHSGLQWQGSTDPAVEAIDYKAVSPFGQQPLLLIDGADPCLDTSSACAAYMYGGAAWLDWVVSAWVGHDGL